MTDAIQSPVRGWLGATLVEMCLSLAGNRGLEGRKKTFRTTPRPYLLLKSKSISTCCARTGIWSCGEKVGVIVASREMEMCSVTAVSDCELVISRRVQHGERSVTRQSREGRSYVKTLLPRP